MRWLSWITRGARATVLARAGDHDIDDEIAFHMASRVDDLVARGLPRAQAERQARLEFGSRDKAADECRDAARFTFVEDFVRDCRYGLRSLLKHPGLIGISVASLALGIGVNTLLFSGVSAVFLAKPTAQRANQLMWVEPKGGSQLAYRHAKDLERTAGFASLSGYRQMSLSAGLDGGATSVSAFVVTPNFFDTLGVSPVIGRRFDPAADAASLGEVIISHAFWRSSFGRDDNVVGKTLSLNGQPYTVVGVLDEDYAPIIRFVDPDVYVPASSNVLPGFDGLDDSNALDIIARLHDEHGLERAHAALASFDHDRQPPPDMPAEFARRPGRIEPVGPLRMSEAPLAARALPPFLAMLCGLVLLIAAANVAGLLLARAAGQQQELALLSALGASRRRVIQRMFAESLLLSIAGAIGGLTLTWLTLPMLQHLTIPLLGVLHFRLRFDWSLGLYAAVLTFITGVACGLVPAVNATRRGLRSQLSQAGIHGQGGRLRLRQAMVIVEAAATVLLLVAALLFTRSLVRLSYVDTGLDLDHGVVSSITLRAGRSRDASVMATATEMLRRLEAQPGIARASIADIVPLSMDISSARFTLEGGTEPTARTVVNSVAPHYFSAMGIPQLAGRDFSDTDRAGNAPVVIVNRAFAETVFANDTAIGRRIRPNANQPFSEIIGVVENNSLHNAGEPPWPQVFYPWLQRPVSSQQRPLNIIVRTDGTPASMLHAIHAVTSSFDTNAPTKTVTLREATSFEFVVRRAGAQLLSGLGLLGWLLAAVGLYGIISYMVAAHRTEFGVRMALGATGPMVRRHVLWRGLRLTLVGLAAGLAIGLVAARLLVSVLAGVSPADPVTFGTVAALLISMGVVGSYGPARRATRIEPMAALRDL